MQISGVVVRTECRHIERHHSRDMGPIDHDGDIQLMTSVDDPLDGEEHRRR